MHYQMQTIRAIQQLHSPPAILIISHHFINEMKEQLINIQELSLEYRIVTLY